MGFRVLALIGAAAAPVAAVTAAANTTYGSGIADGSSGESSTHGKQRSQQGILKGICPKTIVIQSDWFPTPERAVAY